MNVIGINGSARRNGNTAILIRTAFAELEKEGIATDLIELGGTKVHGCMACMKCIANKDRRCAETDDCINDILAKIDKADGVLLGSPTYIAGCSAQLKAVIDRVAYVARANGDMLKRKVGAAIVAVRRGGAIHAFDTINHFFTIGQMITVGSSYWNIGIGRNIGEVEKDDEGMATMKNLGANMAWVLKKLNA